MPATAVAPAFDVLGVTWPYLLALMGIINGLVVVIYNHHKSELSLLKTHIERVELDFDSFKRTEFKELQNNVNLKLDQVIGHLHQLNLNLVQNYASKSDLREVAQDHRQKP